ncbi:MAG: PKD domain-containing protein, partial [Sphingobacteriales bacterium]
MAKLYFRIILLFFAPALFIPVAAQDHNSAPVKPPEIAKTLQFIETKNRIGHEVQYEAAVHGGKLFLHPDKFTYAFYDLGDGHKHTDEAATGKKAHSREEKPRGHAYSVTFSGAHKATLKATGQTHGIYNYYLGNDQSKWVSGAKGYRQIDYDNLYPGIDMRLHEQGGKLKYEFFLEKGANPALIKMKYEGADKLEIRNGDLIVTTSINTVTEGRPYTYQIVNGVEKAVRCNFKVAGKEVSFELPDGYDQNLPLVIDPVLTYSTYSGSVADNWGYTATFDSVGNIYSGGIVFGGGFPVTTGSFDASFNGSNAMMHDIGILKYDPTQTGAASLVYATYIGGSGAESPHSLVVNNANELLILGSTGSSNYPVTSLAYSQLFKGGPSVTPLNLGTLNASHPNGVDIIISKLNSTGGSLLASTFLGGTDNDGVMVNANPLVKNYGDQFRGDIVVDASDNIFISSMTSSANFPIVDGFQPLYGGGATDAVVCMLSGDLSTILWSSFLGGSLADAAFSVQVASTGSVFVCGGTHSNNFPTAPGGHKPVYGNNGDGFVARISVTGDILEQSTYIGTSSYDQTYFVQLDQSENVYVLGQTLGTYPVTPGTYSEANAKQFIHALDYNLTNTVFSTTFGSANAQINISPTAFLVNECNRIYVAGWGGAINSPFSGYLGGFTTGMDTTSNATQPNTDGSDFYLMQLSQNAASLDFATFIGSPTVPEHVDGGTSRFDKRGNIYHAVCACGGILGNFPTTPGAWSETNASGNCNNAAFKYAIPELAADFIPSLIPNGPRETETCEPGTFYFRRVHSGGVTYLWDFGDSTTSNSPGPLSHSYAGPGNYIVTLTITDSSTCVITDMAVDTVHVLQASGSVSQNAIMCQPYAVQLEATGGSSYSWSPAAGLSDPFVSDPVASPDTTTTYTVNIGNSSGCIRTLMVEVVVIEEPVIVNFDSTGICRGQSTQLSATPGLGYVWTPNYALSSTTAANPIASPDSSVTYTVVVDAGLGCVYTKYVEVLVNSVPQIQAIGDANICGNDSVQLNVLADSANYSYQWSPAAGLSSDTVANPMANPPVSVTYYVTVTNSGNCQTTDSVQVSVIEAASIATQGPVSICETVPVQLSASPATGYAYTWSPDSTLSDGSISNPIATPSVTTTYYLTATAQNCTFTDSILVTVNAFPVVQMPADTSFCFGSSVMLNTIGSPQYSYQWSPGAGLSDSTIANPVANPLTSTW